MRLSSIALCAAVTLAACSVPAVDFTPLDGATLDAPDAVDAPDAPDASGNCGDGQRNGSETDIDCGGACGPCTVGKACEDLGDCTTGVCTTNQCQAASCADDVKNGDETDLDCGGTCDPCSNGRRCEDTGDCASQICMDTICQAATCGDDIQNGTETDLDCGGLDCAPCAIGKACGVGTDCASGGACDAQQCRVAQSCAEILRQHPGASDGAYTIAPAGTAPFGAYCDMTRDDGGGWTLLLKASGDTTFEYNATVWTDTTLRAETDLTTQPANAKYPAFLSLPITELRGELDGYRYTKAFASKTALQIFSGAADFIEGHPMFNTGAAHWSTQPNCHIFGVNTPFEYAHTRFGWSANQENDCLTNDTAIGFGLTYINSTPRGAGYICQAADCTPDPATGALMVDAPANGLLWGR